MTETLPQINEGLMQFLYRVPIGLLQTTLAGDIVMINPMAARFLLPLAGTAELANLFTVVGSVLPDLREQARQSSEEPGTTICDDLRFTVGNGAAGETTLALGLQRLDAEHLIASVADVTLSERAERRRLANQLHDAARIDPLTGLPNRVAMLEALESAAAEAKHTGPSLALLYLNVDRFSAVNVALGESGGDRLLRKVARRLTRAMRREDTVARAGGPLASRIGGDEFVALVTEPHGSPAAIRVARRLVKAFARPFDIDGQEIRVGASVGIARARPHRRLDPESLLQEARIAMREAKRCGGARVADFHAAMKRRATERGTLEQDLRRALESDQLFVVYQPIVPLTAVAGHGFEALVRWRHPERGLVAPVEFIPVAEECGLIGALGRHVLELSCQQLASWQRRWGSRMPERISVNLSRAQLEDPALERQIERALRGGGLSPSRLQLELTESMAGQASALQTKLPALKALGVSLALDDFGTGYSSLACLHQLPVDVVKIDRSFVSQAATSSHHRVLIDATIRVARSLAMTTVAEGIETRAQADVVRELGCDKAQGYLFGRPMEAVEAEAWWERHFPMADAASA